MMSRLGYVVQSVGIIVFDNEIILKLSCLERPLSNQKAEAPLMYVFIKYFLMGRVFLVHY